MSSLAWAAGFFDGEGCVGLWKNPSGRHSAKFRRLTAAVSQNDEATLLVFHKLLGGRFSGPYRATGNRVGHYRLAFSGQAVIDLYAKLKDFLVFKGPQFEKAIGEYNAYKSTVVRGRAKSIGLLK